MNQSVNIYFVSMIVLIVFCGNISTKQFCWAEGDESENSTVTPKKPTTDFRQLTNQELLDNGHNIIAIGTPSIEKSLKENQRYYDAEFKIFCPTFNYYTGAGEADMGFLKQLEWVVETNKTTYEYGEPIGFRLFLRNISDEEITLMNASLMPGFILNSIDLKQLNRHNDKSRKVYLTQRGFRQYSQGGYAMQRRTSGFCHLKPGEKVPVECGITMLNLFYDLSDSFHRKYELTFYTRNFIGENQMGEYPKPCTIRFEIEQWPHDPNIVWPNETN